MAVDLNDVLSAHEHEIKNTLFTALPATITSVDDYTSQGVVDVQPQINRVLQNNRGIPSQQRYQVPVVFPAGGGAVMSFPLRVGDEVLLVFSMRSTDEWKNSTDGLTTPQDRRISQGTDGFAIPCVYRMDNAPDIDANNVVIRHGGATITISDDSIELERGNASVSLSSDQTIQIGSGSTVSIRNQQNDLVSLINDLATQVAAITVTVNGTPTPINNLAAVQQIITQLTPFVET